MTTTEKITILRESKKEHESSLKDLEGELRKKEEDIYLEKYRLESLNRTIKELEADLENEDASGPRRF